MHTKNICGFVATGSKSWSFLTVNFKVFLSQKKRIYWVISL